MLKIALFSLLFLFSLPVYAAENAVTESGDIVILNDDGTWQRVSDAPAVTISENKTTFTTPKSSTFTLKSQVTNASFTINPLVWKFNRDLDNGAKEYTLKPKNMDIYALVISEAIEIPLENLANIALQNAQSVAIDARVAKREYRNVNGHRVIYQEMLATLQGIKFKYYGYYFSNKQGSTQYLAYTAENLSEKYEAEIYKLLDGFSLQQP